MTEKEEDFILRPDASRGCLGGMNPTGDRLEQCYARSRFKREPMKANLNRQH